MVEVEQTVKRALVIFCELKFVLGLDYVPDSSKVLVDR